MTKKILVVYINRAEEGMLIPIMKRIEKDKELKLLKLDLREYINKEFPILNETGGIPLTHLGAIYEYVFNFVEYEKPDIAIVGYDRQEMIFSTLAIFHSNIHPIIHLQAGDCDPDVPVFDEAHRFAISVYADVHLCVTEVACNRMIELRNLMGKNLDNIYKIPPTNLDDLEFDNHLVPKEPYDLVLLHPCTKKPKLVPEDILMVEKEIQKNSRKVILLNPNGDLGSELIDKEWKYWAKHLSNRVVYHPNGVPRPSFLALLRECDRFISNSSATIFEAPYFLEEEQIINIGLRNKGRERLSKDELVQGGSDRIMEILRELGG